MQKYDNNKGTPSKGTTNKINLDYDWNTEYGDGDIPDIDKPRNNANNSQSNNKQKEKEKTR